MVFGEDLGSRARPLLALTACVFVACGNVDSADHGAGGAGGAAAGHAGTNASGGLPSNGGRVGSGGQVGSGGAAAGSESGGAPAVLVSEADPNEACVADPLADHWRTEKLTLAQSGRAYRVGAGGDLTLLVVQRSGALEVRLFTPGGGWSEATPIPSTAGGYPVRVDVSPDGSLALLLWSRDDDTLLSAFVDGAFREPIAFPFTQSAGVAMLAQGRALFAFENGQGINPLEYTQQGGLVARSPVFANYDGVYATGPTSAGFFSQSSFVAEADTWLPYVFGGGADGREELPARVSNQSIYQSFFFGFPNGRAMRVIRQWQDAATDGLWVTTRQASGWSAETRVTPFGGDDVSAPLVGYATTHLLVAWSEAARASVREHDGDGWLTETALPRSRALKPEVLLGAQNSALLIGEQVISAEKVSSRKLYRRGSDGTWYCAQLLPNAISFQAASSGARFVVAELVREQLELSIFEP